MKRSRFTEEQISYALRQAESSTPVADVCRQLGVSEASFYVWKKKYGWRPRGIRTPVTAVKVRFSIYISIT
jgi:transposase-like protein